MGNNSPISVGKQIGCAIISWSTGDKGLIVNCSLHYQFFIILMALYTSIEGNCKGYLRQSVAPKERLMSGTTLAIS